MKIALKTIFLFFTITLFSEGFILAGVYDEEISAVKKYLGEYIEQNQKNIMAVGRLANAYEHIASNMQEVIRARKMLQGKCFRSDQNEFKECLARQSVAITMLDTYTRHSERMIADAREEVISAGKILSNQDVSGHLARVDSVGKDFKIWREESIPALKEVFAKERALFIEKGGQDYVKSYREKLFVDSDKVEAGLLGQEIGHTARNLVERGKYYLDHHRLGRAHFTLDALYWLQKKTPDMWTAITADAAAHPKVKKVIQVSYQVIQECIDRLHAEIGKRDAATELRQGLFALKSEVRNAALSERDQAAFKNLFDGFDKLDQLDASNKIRPQEVLLERGYVWLEAVK